LNLSLSIFDLDALVLLEKKARGEGGEHVWYGKGPSVHTIALVDRESKILLPPF